MNRYMKYLLGVCLAFLTIAISGLQVWAAKPVLDLDLSAGYRVDQLQWNIAGNLAGTNPNILSELTWKDLEIFQIEQRGKLNWRSEEQTQFGTELSWSVGYGQIYSGSNQDSDYAGDNRTLEWSRSNNSADDGSVLDLSAAFGMKFFGQDSSFYFMPKIGLAINEQRLSMTDGRQTFSDQAVFDAWTGQSPTDVDYITLLPPGSFAGLDSSYETRWVGPWFGFEMQKDFSRKLSLHAGFEYHRVDYEAEANWNLRSDLEHPVSFRHDGDGTGKVYTLGADYSISERWAFSLQGKYQDWKVSSGVDRVFLADNTQAVTLLREVTWVSYEVMAGLRYRF